MANFPFLSHISEMMVLRHYAKCTIETYLYWIRYYILFHHKAHPNTLQPADVEHFLSYLANQRNVSASTQAVALKALNFCISRSSLGIRI